MSDRKIIPILMREEESDGDDEAPQHQIVELDIGTVRYAKRGEGGEDLILIHGFGGDLDNWVLNIDSFGDVGTVYALDLPGHGRSVKTMPSPPVDGLAATVLSFMDKLGIGKVHLAGHSLGGLIAILLAKRAPARIKSLTLIASAGLGPALNNAYLAGFVAASSRQELRSVFELLFTDPRQLSQPMIDELFEYKCMEGVGDALRTLHADVVVDGLQRRILAGELKSLGMPVLAIAGKQDRVVPVRQTFRLRHSIQTSIIRDAGHMVQMEKYKTVNELLRKHIASAA